MKVATLYSFDDIRIEEVPIPQINHNEILIKTKSAGICSGDVMPWYIEKKAPLVLGHEFSGIVQQVGSQVKDIRKDIHIGDKVFVHHHAPCMGCDFCIRGDYVHCHIWKSSKINPGGISEYIAIPEVNLKNDTLHLPNTLSFEDGAMIEPIACVVKSLKRAHIKKGDTVVVLGLGIMGQIHIMLAKKYNAGKVIGIDKIPFRLNKALKLGADEVINYEFTNTFDRLSEITNSRMANTVIVCPNSLKAMEDGIKLLSPGGTVVFFSPANPQDLLTFNINELYFRDISIVNSYSCGPDDTREALELICRGIARPQLLITHRFTIDKTKEAYSLVAEARDSLKVMINF